MGSKHQTEKELAIHLFPQGTSFSHTECTNDSNKERLLNRPCREIKNVGPWLSVPQLQTVLMTFLLREVGTSLSQMNIFI